MISGKRIIRKMRLNNKVIAYSSIVFIFIIIVIVFQFGKDSEITGKKAIKIVMDKADLEVRSVHYTDVGDSEAKWDMRADTARYLKDSNSVIFKNVKIHLVLDSGIEFNMTGDNGKLKTDTKNVEMWGHVRVDSNKGEHFAADHISYLSSEKKLYTDSPVEMENAYMKLRGRGMSFSIANRELHLLSDVKALISYEANKNR